MNNNSRSLAKHSLNLTVVAGIHPASLHQCLFTELLLGNDTSSSILFLCLLALCNCLCIFCLFLALNIFFIPLPALDFDVHLLTHWVLFALWSFPNTSLEKKKIYITSMTMAFVKVGKLKLCKSYNDGSTCSYLEFSYLFNNFVSIFTRSAMGSFQSCISFCLLPDVE